MALQMATWNLRHGRGAHGIVDLGAVGVGIAALDVDAVAVQEVDRLQRRSGGVYQVAQLADRLGWHGLFAATILGRSDAHRPAGPDAPDHGGPAYGIGLLSRHPLTAASKTLLPSTGAVAPAAPTGSDPEPRIVLGAVVDTAVGQMWIGATHVSWSPWIARRQVRAALESVADPRGAGR